jgi:hypothetical protein
LPATNISGFSHAFNTNDGWKVCASTFSNSTFITEIYDVYASLPDVNSNTLKMKVFPNPGKGSCQLNLLADHSIYAKILVFNALGQLIKTIVSGNLEPGNHQFRFEGKPGIYYLQTNLDGIMNTEKIILY